MAEASSRTAKDTRRVFFQTVALCGLFLCAFGCAPSSTAQSGNDKVALLGPSEVVPDGSVSVDFLFPYVRDGRFHVLQSSGSGTVLDDNWLLLTRHQVKDHPPEENIPSIREMILLVSREGKWGFFTVGEVRALESSVGTGLDIALLSVADGGLAAIARPAVIAESLGAATEPIVATGAPPMQSPVASKELPEGQEIDAELGIRLLSESAAEIAGLRNPAAFLSYPLASSEVASVSKEGATAASSVKVHFEVNEWSKRDGEATDAGCAKGTHGEEKEPVVGNVEPSVSGGSLRNERGELLGIITGGLARKHLRDASQAKVRPDMLFVGAALPVTMKTRDPAVHGLGWYVTQRSFVGFDWTSTMNAPIPYP